MKCFWIIFLYLIAFLIFPSSALAINFYVSTSGNDNNPGTETLPFRTVQKGLNSSTQDGDQIFIKSGTYDLAGFSKTMNNVFSLLGENKNSTILNDSHTLIITKGATVKNLTFSNSEHTIFAPYAASGSTLNGLVVDNVIFDSVLSAVSDNTSLGKITNVTIKNSEFKNMTSPGSIFVIRFTSSTMTELSNVDVSNNTFSNIASAPLKAAFAVFFGDAYVPNYKNIYHHISVSDNSFNNIVAGVGAVEGNIEGHAILVNGSYYTIHGNLIRGLNEGPDHEAIYLKAGNSIISDNDIENGDGGAINRSDGADITIKGDGNVNNVISGNKITSTLPVSGIGIMTLGGVQITNNYVKKPGGWFAVWSAAIPDQPVIITNNYLETESSGASTIKISDANVGEIAYNTIISYASQPIYLSRCTNISVHDNNTCVGYNCGPIIPPNPGCQNLGYVCCNGCQTNLHPEYNNTCDSGSVCCDSCSFGQIPSPTSTSISTPTSTPVPTPKPGDANGDALVNESDYLIWFSNYNQQHQGPTYGDFNNDGKVNGVDYVIWLNNFN